MNAVLSDVSSTQCIFYIQNLQHESQCIGIKSIVFNVPSLTFSAHNSKPNTVAWVYTPL